MFISSPYYQVFVSIKLRTGEDPIQLTAELLDVGINKTYSHNSSIIPLIRLQYLNAENGIMTTVPKNMLEFCMDAHPIPQTRNHKPMNMDTRTPILGPSAVIKSHNCLACSIGFYGWLPVPLPFQITLYNPYNRFLRILIRLFLPPIPLRLAHPKTTLRKIDGAHLVLI
ncbi:hypothetical protein CC78DRAFT_56915 [Lojkania enalia]|uniref:Uncharacterized protein n=1 Tax=Lojkania enalia TaxID=147567 RepID=A0A9P4JZV0_9PLEO|nr:hypothetical protein CC78DRAFT_56915 [Didymosphaeria enalia]